MTEVRVVFPLAIRSLIAGACADDGDDVCQLDVEEGYSQKLYRCAKEANAGLQTNVFWARLGKKAPAAGNPWRICKFVT